MGALAQRRSDHKTAWHVQRVFAVIDTVSLLFKTGRLSREDAARFLLEKVGEKDLREYKAMRGYDPLD